MQIYLAVTPQQAHTATTYDCTLIHMAYHIGPASTLLRQNPLLQTQGGLLLVCDQDAPFIDSPEELCAAVLRECSRRNYEGVMLDFEEPVRRDRLRFVETLGNILAEKKKKLFLPVSYGHVAPQANILVDTALSGGTLFEHLKDAAKHSHGRFALDMATAHRSSQCTVSKKVYTSKSPKTFNSLVSIPLQPTPDSLRQPTKLNSKSPSLYSNPTWSLAKW